MPLALEQIVKQLADSGVIAPGKLENFLPPKATPTSAEDLVKDLVRQKHLTKFQAQEIYSGRGKSLILGNYTILDKIGAGGMGQVFKAEHRRMHRIVAIKMLPASTTKDAAAMARFEREVEAAAKLEHPNIVTAHDADQAGSTHFLVMQYVEGIDLSALIKKDGPLPINKALNYTLQAARGLEFAHGEGVVHRDIKPANLLLDKKGTVKILDMGLARIETRGDAATQAELTGTGAILGTIDYMAPEQAMSTKGADARADIYSLGCTLYYLLTGRATYDGDTLMAKLLAHREAPIPSLQDVAGNISAETQAIFSRMVAKKLEDRYQTMAEVIGDLERVIAVPASTSSIAPPASSSNSGLTELFNSLQATSTRKSKVAATRQSARRRTEGKPAAQRNWKRYAWIGLGSLACIVIGGLLYSFSNDANQPAVANPSKAAVPVVKTSDLHFGLTKLAERPPTWKPGPKDDVMYGIVSRPAKLPGIKRWQIHTKAPTHWLGDSHRTHWSPAGEFLAIRDGQLTRVYRYGDGELQPYRNFFDRRGVYAHADFSADGQRLAMICAIQNTNPHLLIYELETGKLAQDKDLGPLQVTDLAWSPDGNWLFVASPNGSDILPMASGLEIPDLGNAAVPARLCAWSPDSKQVALLETDKPVRLRNLHGDEQVILAGEPAEYFRLAWSHNGQWIAAGGTASVQIWKTTGEAYHQVKGEGTGLWGNVFSLAWSTEEPQLAVGSTGNLSVTSLAETPQTEILAPQLGGTLSVAFRPRGKELVVAGGQTSPIISLIRGKQIRQTISPRASAQHVVFSADNGRIAYIMQDKRMAVQDADGDLEYRLSSDGSQRARLAWSPNGRYMALPRDGFVRIWDAQKNLELAKLPAPAESCALSWHPNSSQLATAGNFSAAGPSPGFVEVWSVPECVKLWRIPMEGTSIAWSPQGDRLMAGHDGTLLSSADGKVMSANLQAPGLGFVNFSWNPAGSRVLATRVYGPIYCYSITPKANRDWESTSSAWGNDEVPAFISPDGKLVATARGLLNADSGAMVKEYDRLGVVNWHPDSRHVVGIYDGFVIVRDTETLIDKYVIAPLTSDRIAVFDTAGNLVRGEYADLDKDLVVFVELEDGSYETATPSKFFAKYGKRP